jgi:alpha-galactosidase
MKSVLLVTALSLLPLAASAQYTDGLNMRIMSASGKGNFCMGSQEERGADGEKVFMLPCREVPNQRWTITTSAGGGAAIVGIGGYCLDVRSHSMAAGAPVQLYACHFQNNQRFAVGRDGTIKEVQSAKCLQAEGDRSGAPIVLESCKGVPAEKWHIQQ